MVGAAKWNCVQQKEEKYNAQMFPNAREKNTKKRREKGMNVKYPLPHSHPPTNPPQNQQLFGVIPFVKPQNNT